MLSYLFDYLTQIHSGFGVLNFLTTRVALTLITSVLITLIFGNLFINKIKSLQFGQIIRTDGVKSHLAKSGTPTAGGILIIFAFTFSTLIWGDLSNSYLWIVIFTAISFATLGFADDYFKVKQKSSDGLSGLAKIFWQVIFASIIIYSLINIGLDTNYLIPTLKNYALELGIVAFVIISLLLIAGFSNAVNLTDGLDGLVIMPTVIIAAGLALFAYIGSNYNFASHLNMDFLPYTSEMLIVLSALIGAGLGFLWFNTYPAQIFMGDTGSLSIGAILITIAIILRQEIIFIIMSFIFVIEMFSVIIQRGYFKWTKRKYGAGKRVFLMAPLHHHYEKKGMSEPKIIVRAWLITIVLVLIALAFIKIR